MKPTKKNATAATVAEHIQNQTVLYGLAEATAYPAKRKLWRSNPTLPPDWRERLPRPEVYYSQHLKKLSRPNAAGWAQACCPFHEDTTASFSVNLTNPRGGWKCFAGCGAGDLLSFHMRLRGLTFVQARTELLGRG